MLQAIPKDPAGHRRTAAALIADTRMAEHIARETIFNTQITTAVHGRVASERFSLGGLTVYPHQKYYLAASRFPGYFYVVVEKRGGGGGEWVCSSSNTRAAPRLIGHVKAHIARRNELLYNEAYQ
jgi:hypothetical protein